jgi:hypothetical protein
MDRDGKRKRNPRYSAHDADLAHEKARDRPAKSVVTLSQTGLLDSLALELLLP